jgi:tetratricopeptide (TPR) repeat protein
MEFNLNPKSSLVHLVTEYESMSQSGDLMYLNEKSYLQLIGYYEQLLIYDKALEVTDQALSQHPHSVDFHVKKASLLLAIKQSDQVMGMLNQLDTSHSLGSDIQIIRVKVLICNKKYSESLNLIEGMKRKKFSNNLEELLLLESSVYENLKEFSKMYDALVECLKLNPNNLEALEKIMLCIEVLRNFDDSELLHQALIDFDPYNFMAWFNLGNTFASTGEYAKAIEAYEFSFLINEEFEEAYLEAIDICAQIKDFNRALKFSFDYIDYFGEDEETLTRIGEYLIHLQRPQEAKKYLSKAVKLDSYNDQANFLMSKALSQIGQWEKSLTWIDKALKVDESYEEYLAHKALVLFSLGDFDRADFYFRKAEEAGPEIMETWLQHAKFLFKVGEPKKALRVLEEAEYHSEGEELAYGKVACLLELGQKSVALECLQALLQDVHDKHPTLFDFNPDLTHMNFISEMINYYKGELI